MLDEPFRGTEALAAGLLTPGVLRGPDYRRLFPDVYAPVTLEPCLLVRSRAAYLWGRVHGGVLGGYSATEVLGAQCAPADAPAEIILRRAHRHAPGGLVIRQDELADDEWRTSQDMDLTTPLRTAYDLARRCVLREAVVALDALAGRFGFAPAEVLTLAERYSGARGTLRLPQVVGLAEPLTESAMESRLRLVLVLAGLPRPVAQYPIRDAGGRVATVDLAYPDELIAIEYEGGDHFTDEQGRRDVHRYTRLVALGWRVYRYTARDVYRHPDRIIADIRRALRRRFP